MNPNRFHRSLPATTGMLARLFAGIGLLATVLMTSPVLAEAEKGKLGVELNKLEDVNGACRAYLVFENRSDSTFTGLKLDLVMFGPDGVIAKRLAVEGAPLPAGKTGVKLFDIQGLACNGIARILINGVMDCRDGNGERDDCASLVQPTSRSDVPLFK